MKKVMESVGCKPVGAFMVAEKDCVVSFVELLRLGSWWWREGKEKSVAPECACVSV